MKKYFFILCPINSAREFVYVENMEVYFTFNSSHLLCIKRKVIIIKNDVWNLKK